VREVAFGLKLQHLTNGSRTVGATIHLEYFFETVTNRSGQPAKPLLIIYKRAWEGNSGVSNDKRV